MFIKNKKYTIEELNEKRREKISIFGVSIYFDWFMIVCLCILLIIFIFVKAILEFQEINNYISSSFKEETLLLEENKIIDKTDEIISLFNKESSISSSTVGEH